jgi:Domain of unknown function (DUF4190)
MVDSKPTISTAVISLVCTILGSLGFVALPAIYSHGLSVETTGVTASVAVLCFGSLSGTLCLLGVIFGMVALRNIRRGEAGGRGKAWTGIVLGCLPFVVVLVWGALALWGEFSARILDQSKKPVSTSEAGCRKNAIDARETRGPGLPECVR